MKQKRTPEQAAKLRRYRKKRKERMTTPNHFGAMIFRYRTNACVSNLELSEETGISPAMLFRYESDATPKLPTRNLIAIAKSLGTTAQNLITEYETNTL